MMFKIGGRVIKSEVKRRQEARDTYERARTEGKTAALTEQERPNLFTQSVANIPPGESVEVLLRYVHEVGFDDGRYTFVFPTTIGPRYLPQGEGHVADGERVTPPVVPPGLASAHDFEIAVRLAPAGAFAGVAAKSHRVVVGTEHGGTQLVGLAADDRVPNKDFVLSWSPTDSEPEARILTERQQGDDYFMLFVQPPKTVAERMVRAKEMVFLLDKSGSMWGAPIETAKRVMMKALRGMGPEDTFQIIAFDGDTQSMSPQALPNTPDHIAAAEKWLGSLEGSGGTEMLRGIRAALDAPSDPKRVRMVVFCTDGFIGNEPEIIAAIQQGRGQTRVFGFGIGTSVNRYLIEGVARAGRGAAEFVDLKEPVDEIVLRLYKRLDRPMLTDSQLSYGGLGVSDLEPEKLPDLHAGQPLVVVGRSHGAPSGEVVLTGKLGAQAYRRVIAPVALPQGTEPVLGTLWARRRIEELSDRNPNTPQPAEIESIVQLGLKFKLLSAYTSFVAVEHTLLADARLPLEQLIVPVEVPEGVSYEHIFGPAEANAEATPLRVKPGDPELRVHTRKDARTVRVTLPFGGRPIEAVRDGNSGDFVARFLVPSGTPDGAYAAAIEILHKDGRREHTSATIKVDSTPAAIAVVSAPARVRPGEALVVKLKPAIGANAIAKSMLSAQPTESLKSAMDIKEILVRAPWGEISTAAMTGPLGSWVATLHVPPGAARGSIHLEIVAADAAGNISRRKLAVEIDSHTRALERGTKLWAGGLALLSLIGATWIVRRMRRPSRSSRPSQVMS
jgi:Ca-activated chloride channel family protein